MKPKLSKKKGHPAFTICDLDHEIETDLIVITCRGNGLTDEGATDSISYWIINLSPSSVLAIAMSAHIFTYYFCI
ncbi:MAG: hypothetical protein O4805_16500 [Trichodesmium sp. St16_bin2-tuft]|nr:hypothetical protein [Trichodesmium sp. St18_bin1]MDE5088643.1 hypothetical protein [Trichodesmium sp. St16_bin2-tuft]MDE5121589.1 hypothetical protein [Trichodesmium sp. St19_bin1]